MQRTSLKGYRLSTQQKRLWTQQGKNQVWYTQCAVWLNGKLDVVALLSALQELVHRHDMLRTAFHYMSGVEIPIQAVVEQLEIRCPVIDVTHVITSDLEGYLDTRMADLQHTISTLTEHPLLALELLRFSEEKHLLLICLPTLCADEKTLIRMVLELSQLYSTSAQQADADEEPLQYAEVADWQEQLLSENDAQELSEQWHQIDLSLLDISQWPFAAQAHTAIAADTHTKKEEGVAGYSYELTLEDEHLEQIRRRAKQAYVSLEAWFLACWEMAIWRLNGMQPSVLGVTCDGRGYEGLTEELARTLGPLAQVVPFMVQPGQEVPFEQVVKTVNRSLSEAAKRQFYFSWETLDAPQNFFPLGFEYVQWPTSFEGAQVCFALCRSESRLEKYYLKLKVVEVGRQVALRFQADPEKISTHAVEEIASIFQTFLKSATTQPQRPVSTLALLAPDVETALLKLSVAPTHSISKLVLHQLFEIQALLQPDNLAAIDLQTQLTYQQLNEETNRLAYVLRRRGVGPGVLVGLCLPRQVSMLVGMLAILKAGGAYLPLDEGNPPQRSIYQLQESQVALLLTHEDLDAQFSTWQGNILCLEALEAELAEAPSKSQPSRSVSEDLAYVIYTSGSTGLPKGVMVKQSSVVNYTLALWELLEAKPGWHYATVSTLAADLGNTAIFCALASGGCVQVLDYEQVTSGENIGNWAQQHPIDVLKIVPSHLSALLESERAQTFLPRQALILGGEALSQQLVERVQRVGGTCRIYNHYGPTETTIGVLVNSLEALEEQTSYISSVPLGRPITNTQAYVLDQQMQLLPMGMVGELYIGGAGVALGYLQQAGQTAERFLPNPFSQHAGERLYCTGDLVRYGEDGKLIFVGRRDRQVKLRGYRIELGEIEAALRRHPLIWDCTVQIQGYDLEALQLVGYVVARTSTGLTTQALRETLRQTIADYMIPSGFVMLEKLPLTPNGKLDRRQLPPLASVQESEPITQEEPRSPIEEILLQLWRELLTMPVIGINDNFFALGGHSLLATRVIARLQALFHVPLSVQMLFDAPTVASLAQRIEQALRQDEGLAMPPALLAKSRPETLPLSYAQQRLWFLDQLEPESDVYLVPQALRFSGELNLAALARSMEGVIQRHEILRTTFAEHAGQPVQVVHPATRLMLPVIDLQGLSQAQRAMVTRTLVTQEAQRPCDLTTGPLLRLTLLRLEPDEHVFLLTLHHIITDGWSNGIFVRELTTLYRAFVAGEELSLPTLAIQYADYALWQRQWLQSAALETQLAYWRKQLAGIVPLELSTDHPRPAVQTYRGMRQTLRLPAELAEGLQALSQQQQVTLFMTLLASFQVLLMHYSGQQDISVGTPIANRRQAEIEGLIGFFVNTLVLRSKMAGKLSFIELLQRVRTMCLEAYTHQDVPFEQVVEALQPERDLSHAPLFQVFFVLQNTTREQEELTGIRVSSQQGDSAVSKFDLTLFVEEMEQGLFAAFEYNVALFEAETIKRMLAHWQILLQSIVQQPEVALSELPLLTAYEQTQQLITWNETQHPYPTNLCVHQLFEQQVQRTPDAVAVIFEEQTLTYNALNQRANQLAHYLRQLKVGPDDRVGIYMERGCEIVIGILGVLKAGGAYVPLDISTPAERLAMLLEDMQGTVLLTKEHLRGALPKAGQAVICLDTDWEVIAAQETSDLPCETLPSHLAYMISTSGSTGRPKGVLITHANVVHSTQARFAYYTEPVSAYLLLSPFFFDSSVAGFYWTLCQGGRLVVLREDFNTDLAQLPQMIRRQHISHLLSIPLLYALIVSQAQPEQLASLRTVIVAGEVCSPVLLQRHQERAPQAELYNEYGPTEGSVWSSVYRCQRSSSATQVPIGRPIANVQCYVLDQGLHPVPIGVPGELYIGGRGVARGYLNRAELTAEQFIPHLYSEEPGARFYRTGDRVRYLPDGNLEFLGRVDQQIKIRGYRIEIGEIEEVLCQHPAVQEAVVQVREEQAGVKRLVAYYVGVQGSELSNRKLQSYVQEHLPAYLHPSTFMRLEALPLLLNGKVDRRALPAPDNVLKEAFIRPRNSVETALTEIWRQVLRVEHIGIYDNFFALGGDSILSIQIVARAKQAGLYTTTRQLFQNQSIAQLSSVITSSRPAQEEQQMVTGPAPLTPVQHWFFQHDLPEPQHFNQAIVLEVQRQLRPAWIDQVLFQIVLHHDALRLRFSRQAEGWQQTVAGASTHSVFLCVDLCVLPAEQQRSTQGRLTEEAQGSIDLTEGPLLRALHFVHGADEADHLLLVIHHLAVDGVSWRILLEDLEVLCLQLERQERLHLIDKTSSWQQWAQRLQDYAQTPECLASQSYWLSRLQRPTLALPVDSVSHENTIATSETLTVSLSAEQTQALLQVVPLAYHTQIQEVLLTALTLAFATWTGQRRLLVDLEGHGREGLVEEVDVSRTVGWFTTIFPVLLDLEQTTEPGEVLKAIKEQIRQVPQKGLSYGVLRYLSTDHTIVEQFAQLPQAEVLFNYLGQFTFSKHEQALFRPAPVSSGSAHSQSEPRSYLLEINGQIFDGELRLTWRYNRCIHHRETIQNLAGSFIACLEGLIVHCHTRTSSAYTPSDFPLALLSQTQLDKLLQDLPQESLMVQAEAQIEDIYPLSPMQAGLLFHSLYAPEEETYSIQLGWTINSELQMKAWQWAWQEVINRHAILRTLFLWEGLTEPLQVVQRRVEAPCELYDWRLLSEQEQQTRLAELTQAKKIKVRDLGGAPIVRLILVRLADRRYYFHFSLHHIITDGWSQSLLLAEVQECYQAACQQRAPRLTPVHPYRDYIAWLQRQNRAQAEQFWRLYLQGFTNPNLLSGHSGRAHTVGQHLAIEQLQCSATFMADLQQRAQQLQVTLNTVLQGAWALLLSHYSGEEDIVFGATTTGRPSELVGVETVIGVFINTLPVRARVTDETRLSEWLRQLQIEQVEARQYEYTALAQIQAWSEVQAGQALFESLMVFQNYPVAASVLEQSDEIEIRRASIVEQTHYPIMIKVVPLREGLLLLLQYDELRFESPMIRRMIQHLQVLLQAVIDQPEQHLQALPLLSADERQQVLVEWNATQEVYQHDGCIHHLFEQQAANTPDRIAVVFEDLQLSYRKLDQQANQLAHYLQQRGIGPDVPVGISMENSSAMMLSVLGILKAGGVVVPLELAYPTERIAFILTDAQVTLVLTQERLVGSLPDSQAQQVLLDRDWEPIGRQGATQPECLAQAEHLAYVIYTSGSTGIPKGVSIPHRVLVNLLTWHRANLYTQARTLQFASLSFDASFHEMFAAWCSGGTLCVLPTTLRRDVIGLAAFLERTATEKMILPVVMLQQLAEEYRQQKNWNRTLKEITATGEQLQITQSVVEMFEVLEDCSLHNHYGPSESHVVTAYNLARPARTWPTHPPIGRPIANTQLYVLDEHFRPVPIGVIGELYIGGANLARGYLRRADMTAERFIPDPFSQQGGERLYKTGDLVRYQADGVIEYLGRRDHQVKIRGYRVELGEIESLLNHHPGVREVVVLAREDGPGGKQLVAYIVPNQGEEALSQQILYHYLQESLPDYMLPSAFVLLDRLPLTSNGKVDRWALPKPDALRPEREASYVAPRTVAEEIVAGIWAKVLGVEQIGIHDNFFEVGGHSLRAIQIISHLRDIFQVAPPLRSLFEQPTIAEFVEEMGRLRGGRSIIEEIAQISLEIEQLSEEDMQELLESDEDRDKPCPYEA